MAHGHYENCPKRSFKECWCEQRRYLSALCVLVATFVIQALGAWHFNSLALIADAAHLATDIFVYVIAIGIAFLIRRSANEKRIRRTGMIVSVMLLMMALGGMVMEIPYRLEHPPEVNGGGMMVIAFIAAVGNIIQHRIVSGGEQHDTNRGLVIHILTDLVASLGIIVAGFVIIVTGWLWVDAVATLLVICWAFLRSFGLLDGDGHDHHHGHSH